MEELTKQQIVLVTLLVSFVTSIATGIVTVSLMEQAPVGVTQTINQVVERTIERVVTEQPAVGNQKANAVSTVVTETIVVSSEDQAVKAIEKNVKSVVKIISRYNGELSVVGLGIIVNVDGSVFADRGILAYGSKFFVKYPDGTTVVAVPVEIKGRRLIQDEIVLLKPTEPLTVPVTPATLGNSDTAKLGQTVIALSGEETPSVTTGVIQSLIGSANARTGTSTTPTGYVHLITTIDPKLTGGSALINLTGEVIGIKVTPNQYSTSGVYVPSNKIKEHIAFITEALKPQQ